MARASVEDAREHFVTCEQELTYAEVAERFDLPLSTLQKRAAREDWQSKRREHQALGVEYSTKVKRVKAQLLDDMLANKGPIDPQLVHAWRSVESAYPEHRYAKEMDDGRRRQICQVLVEELVAELGENAPSALKEVAPLVRPLMERWLAADWDRR